MASFAAFSHPQIDLLPEQGAASDEIRTQVWGLLSTLYRQSHGHGTASRDPLPLPLPRPPDARGRGRRNPLRRERGRGGQAPFRARVGLLSSPAAALSPHDRLAGRAAGGWFGFLIDLTWCRFTRQGWYESGGRFLESVDFAAGGKPLAGDARKQASGEKLSESVVSNRKKLAPRRPMTVCGWQPKPFPSCQLCRPLTHHSQLDCCRVPDAKHERQTVSIRRTGRLNGFAERLAKKTSRIPAQPPQNHQGCWILAES